jgi:hypothetical protein
VNSPTAGLRIKTKTLTKSFSRNRKGVSTASTAADGIMIVSANGASVLEMPRSEMIKD